jgi:glycogen debranching enzyme
LYEPDGYWRGPIWAPSTHIIYDGLRQLGEHDRALEVARRFCETCRTSGLPENFDALTGAPLRDKAYTWTASVFLLLAHDLNGFRERTAE